MAPTHLLECRIATNLQFEKKKNVVSVKCNRVKRNKTRDACILLKSKFFHSILLPRTTIITKFLLMLLREDGIELQYKYTHKNVCTATKC